MDSGIAAIKIVQENVLSQDRVTSKVSTTNILLSVGSAITYWPKTLRTTRFLLL
ncbi:unnamed protein product [Staurois parvus]|uniref:Uncharacterized protein n=1 Tax=Staurois parvus TaxID=386267 RepID=A0ABN9GQ40_9NEOB|nr:unnamed protein product [Staurois parvus]